LVAGRKLTSRLAALVPIFPFVFSIDIWDALIASVIGIAATLFGVGAMKTIFSRRDWVRSCFETIGKGASATAITHVIGTLFYGNLSVEI
jgi:VIT1/CCC1 family predicted Fe2+/Mn2+ transporter